MKPVRIVPAETTGAPWVLWSGKASLHDLPRALYIVAESATWSEAAPAGTHDGLRDGEQRARCTGRVRAYWLAHDWVDAGHALPEAPIRSPDDRLLASIFGTLAEAVEKQRAEFAARAAVEAAEAAARAEREARYAEQREARRRADAEQRERRRAEAVAFQAAWDMVERAIDALQRDGLELPALGSNEYMSAHRRILAESCADPERAADILAEECGLLEEP